MNKPHLLGAMSACILILIATTTNAAVMPLESRLGGLAYYDPNLDITWATDTAQGILSWEIANDWAANQVIGGVSGWRLPNADVNGDGTVIDCAPGGVLSCKDNEMDYLYWEEGISSDSPGPFSNLQGFNYWTNTEFSPDPVTVAWSHRFIGPPLNDFNDKNNNFYVLAVRSGDVGTVPVPAAIWLFGSGMLALIGVTRGKKGCVAMPMYR